jgi:transcriptional regulator with XRE-family HTH domain
LRWWAVSSDIGGRKVADGMSVATIGSALAERRRELGLEKGQAADKIGMSRTTYSSYEQDAQRPSVDVFPALTEFLEISMEELLTLYGATCVAAVRPSLERLLSDRGDNPNESTSVETPSDVEVFAPKEEDASDEPEATFPEIEESTSEVVLELHEVTIPPDTQDQDSPSPEYPSGEPEATFLETEESTSEVVLELHEATVQPDTQDQESHSLPDLEGLADSQPTPISSDSQGETSEPTSLSSSPAEPSVGSVVFEPSPYFIRTSLSESDAKNHDPKKKKKKKKKKK